MHSEPKTQPCGELIMASTHIGNIEDTPKRTLQALKNSDLLIFEEDRPARLLLKEAGITREYTKYNEHKPQETLDELKKQLKEGKSAVYVSDQGSPTLADPGQDLLKIAYSLKAKVKVIPGPSSLTAAISACPFSVEGFLFKGFLPADSEKRTRDLQNLKNLKNPIIFLDTPYRLEKLLDACSQVFPKERKAFLAMDISGEDENYLLGSFSELKERTHGKKANFVLIISGL